MFANAFFYPLLSSSVWSDSPHLVPRLRVNLVLDYGLLAPRAAWRRAVVPTRMGR